MIKKFGLCIFFNLYYMDSLKLWKQEFAQLLQLPNITIENGPINIIIYVNKNNQIHRNQLIGAAHIKYYENGNISGKEYYTNNKLHRLDGPAIIDYYENGNVRFIEYYKNEKKHRLDEPAYIEYYENGGIRYKRYYVNNERHRLDGPANIGYYENGDVFFEEYYENDKHIG